MLNAFPAAIFTNRGWWNTVVGNLAADQREILLSAHRLLQAMVDVISSSGWLKDYDNGEGKMQFSVSLMKFQFQHSEFARLRTNLLCGANSV